MIYFFPLYLSEKSAFLTCQRPHIYCDVDLDVMFCAFVAERVGQLQRTSLG